jgi:hypothetical protein
MLSGPSLSGSKQQSSNQQQYELDACPILLAMIRNLTIQVKFQIQSN